MAVSTPPVRPPATTIYGLDADTWRRFRAWCTWHNLTTGEQVTEALEQHMRSRPLSTSDARQASYE